MTFKVQETAHDHIPEEFTVASLKADGLTDREIELLGSGDDPIVDLTPEVTAEEAAKGDPAIEAGVGTPPTDPAEPVVANPAPAEPVVAPEPAAAEPIVEPAPVVKEVPEPEMVAIPDTSAQEAIIAAASDTLKGLIEKYDDGELTSAELLAAQAEAVNSQAQAQADINAAAALQNRQVQAQRDHFYSRIDAYKEVVPELWEEEHFTGFDQAMHSVTGNAEYADLTRDQQIRLAHDQYAAVYKARTGKELSVGKQVVPPVAEPDPKLTVAKGDKPKPPQTLAGMNSESTAEIEDSTFAAVDRLIMTDPIGSEKAFERMTPEQQENFLNGG